MTPVAADLMQEGNIKSAAAFVKRIDGTVWPHLAAADI